MKEVSIILLSCILVAGMYFIPNWDVAFFIVLVLCISAYFGDKI